MTFLFVLVLALSRISGKQVITRPNTGTLAYELDLYELLEKYARVPDEEQAIAAVQYAWTQVIHSTGV